MLHKPTLSGVLVSLMVNEVSHTATIVQPLLMVEGLKRLAGAVGLLSGHTTLFCIQRGGVVLGVFGAAAPGEGAVPTILQVHAGVGHACVRVGSEGGEIDTEEEKEVGGRRTGLLAILSDVNLHFIYLEDKDIKMGMEREESAKING